MIEEILKQLVRGELRFFNFRSEKRSYDKFGISYKGDFISSIHDKEIKESNTCKAADYLPNILIPSIPYQNFDYKRERKYGEGRCDYNKLICPLEKDITLILTTEVGNVSDSYLNGKGFTIMAGINYHGMMINMYNATIVGNDYHINGVLSEDFFNLIDYKNFIKGENDNYYLTEYHTFYDSSGNADYNKLLELYVEDETFYWYDTIPHVLNILGPVEKNKKALSSLSEMSFTKFVAKNGVRGLYGLQLPKTCTYINFEFLPFSGKKESWELTTFEKMEKASNDALADYSDFFDDKYKSKAIKAKNKLALQVKYNTQVVLYFKYKGLWSTIFTNMYAYEKMLDYYKSNDPVFNICDNEITIKSKDLLKNIILSTKLGNKAEKTMEFLKSDKLGNNDWWLKEFDNYPPDLF